MVSLNFTSIDNNFAEKNIFACSTKTFNPFQQICKNKFEDEVFYSSWAPYEKFVSDFWTISCGFFVILRKIYILKEFMVKYEIFSVEFVKTT